MNPKLEALLAFLVTLGCTVKHSAGFAAIAFPIDSIHLDLANRLCRDFARNERSLDWFSSSRANGDFNW